MALFISVSILGTDKWLFYEVQEDFTVRDLKERVARDTGIPVGEQRICAHTAMEKGSSFRPLERKVSDFTIRPEGLFVLWEEQQQLAADMRELNDAFQVPTSWGTRTPTPPNSLGTPAPTPQPAPEASCCAGIRTMCSVM
uniref:Ubiquitin-like domain-containing protein n=1 Tax=Alexandrium catenella TaxID=2925 RepID=A0A7S1LTK3_ALECA|mmetsp:Transcript_13555/g.37273  ORF Transcript_13555/g.37273 Transcript_13555/m.37273 type:complete len:140 (+) Transcript_13555:54-473(+)|eukprot:CAMPEP_0171191822 /NCGR_PEP_ID=MMETSP0790-20130122/19558_1 /TAXON_ID=2925 /ORGANISM="Alexandrium catenella, Strain OF101" /LENGTH=139 /DNA_ID=CAMNT_0011656973 /DNA_START=54 /DNA_END=473 /DNA_ORIENTATION=+